MDDKNKNESVSLVVVEAVTASTVATAAPIDKLEMPPMPIAYNLSDNNLTNVTLMQIGGYDNPMTMRYRLFSIFI